ncbi:MAG: DUF4349 domain-containing protein [Parasporobacterium sp.]|nr:DUF4349 domain-containing protein [Parasporobacterium sp.]
MKAEKFSESLTNVNDKYIEEAASYGSALSNRAAGANQADASYQTAASNQTVDFDKKTKPFRALKVWRVIAIAACALLAVGITGAAAIALSSGSKSSYRSEDAGYYDAGAANDTGSYMITDEFYEEPAAEGYYDSESASGDAAKGDGLGDMNTMMPANDGAKIIYTANLTVQTTEFDQARQEIEEKTKQHGGYFANMDLSNYDSSYRRGYFEVRIPAENLEAFLNDANQFGTVTSISKEATDVSDYYYDVESRLETEKTKLARLQELLSQAQDMSDIITIENEISNVQWEIDNLSGTLKSYDSQIEYSTVMINLDEVYRITDDDTPLNFGQRIAKGFKDGMKGFGNAMEDFIVWLAGNWLWVLIVIAVILAAILIPVNVVKNKNRNRK